MRHNGIKNRKIFYLVLMMALTQGCGGRNTSSNVEAPGEEKTAKDKLLTTGAELMQAEKPLKQFSTYLDGFHFYNGNINAQMEAHHYVGQLNADVYQAIIFDGNAENAKIMGVEYIVTEKVFRTLDPEEKRLWHSHAFEVSSGSLVAPGIPRAAEHELMEKLISTYGKTIHTWHTDQERTLPVGAPMIMMGFTKDGQLRQNLLDDRDQRFGLSTGKIREDRRDIPVPRPDSGADAWQKGQIRQIVISSQPDSAIHKHK